jgi:hypothetical protein
MKLNRPNAIVILTFGDTPKLYLFEFEQLLTAEQIQKVLRHSNLEPFIEIFSFHNAGKTQHVLIDLRSSAGGRSEKI